MDRCGVMGHMPHLSDIAALGWCGRDRRWAQAGAGAASASRPYLTANMLAATRLVAPVFT